MDLTDYLIATHETAIYPGCGSEGIWGISYVTLGLNGEAGEVAEQIKKAIRDDSGVITDDRRHALKKELGDVLWYWVMCCYELGIDPNEVAERNLEKLGIRKDLGLLGGSGSDRESAASHPA